MVVIRCPKQVQLTLTVFYKQVITKPPSIISLNLHKNSSKPKKF